MKLTGQGARAGRRLALRINLSLGPGPSSLFIHPLVHQPFLVPLHTVSPNRNKAPSEQARSWWDATLSEWCPASVRGQLPSWAAEPLGGSCTLI